MKKLFCCQETRIDFCRFIIVKIIISTFAGVSTECIEWSKILSHTLRMEVHNSLHFNVVYCQELFLYFSICEIAKKYSVCSNAPCVTCVNAKKLFQWHFFNILVYGYNWKTTMRDKICSHIRRVFWILGWFCTFLAVTETQLLPYHFCFFLF